VWKPDEFLLLGFGGEALGGFYGGRKIYPARGDAIGRGPWNSIVEQPRQYRTGAYFAGNAELRAIVVGQVD
jgi:hypothetical protein